MLLGRAFYSEADFCAGRKVCVVTNLKPAKMAGFESCGMVLCAANEDHTKVELLEPPEGAKVGERVVIDGLEGEPLQPNQVRVQGSGFKVQGSLFRVEGSRFRFQGSGFIVQG